MLQVVVVFLVAVLFDGGSCACVGTGSSGDYTAGVTCGSGTPCVGSMLETEDVTARCNTPCDSIYQGR